MTPALLALGGNLGDVRATLTRAVAMLCADGRVVLTARSADYETPPWGDPDQPSFINGAIAVATDLSPQALLERALDVERTFGRDRTQSRRWGPRPIDIDILTYGDLHMETDTLTLPHPRILERAFVLMPLADIAPDEVIAGVRVRDALAALDTAGITRLAPQI
jgi:2-amino-4-hydroxy-6-hydroxymethyldihydropteridine diphosphokinase